MGGNLWGWGTSVLESGASVVISGASAGASIAISGASRLDGFFRPSASPENQSVNAPPAPSTIAPAAAQQPVIPPAVQPAGINADEAPVPDTGVNDPSNNPQDPTAAAGNDPAPPVPIKDTKTQSAGAS